MQLVSEFTTLHVALKVASIIAIVTPCVSYVAGCSYMLFMQLVSRFTSIHVALEVALLMAMWPHVSLMWLGVCIYLLIKLVSEFTTLRVALKIRQLMAMWAHVPLMWLHVFIFPWYSMSARSPPSMWPSRTQGNAPHGQMAPCGVGTRMTVLYLSSTVG